ncbi:hypothetical protein C0J52_19721 [Blattella germanica]|nr:hypothetical protein C0J52_19721 [Blattella germanica]
MIDLMPSRRASWRRISLREHARGRLRFVCRKCNRSLTEECDTVNSETKLVTQFEVIDKPAQ